MNPELFDFVHIVVSRSEVEAVDTSAPLAALNQLISTEESIRDFRQRVNISFHGYENTREELFEIPEVRSYVHALDAKFPYWLYFLSLDCEGLQCLALCYLPPYLTEEARQRIHPERLADLIDRRWGPALNQICAASKMSEQDTDLLLMDTIEYFKNGPRLKMKKG